MKRYFLLLFLIVFILGCTQQITNFEECIAAGNPAMESYPRQCRANGETFVEEIDQPIGGERDEHGCLGPAGYTYDEDIGACTRSWEIEEVNQKKAAKIAVDHIGKADGLTITEVKVARCPGCFAVHLTTTDYGQIDVALAGWEVIEKELECTTDDDCTTGGCSGTVCQPKDIPPAFTTCEFLPEYACYNQISCRCIGNKCLWDETQEFNDCIEQERES